MHRSPGFVYRSAELVEEGSRVVLHVRVTPDARTKAICSGCKKRRAGCDTLPQRAFEFVPLWAIAVFFLYSMRRVDCPTCGILVESVP